MDVSTAVLVCVQLKFPMLYSRCSSSPPARLPACLPAAGVGSPAAPAPLQGCRAAQLMTDREMRGGDAGWGHKQGEAEEEKAERESPALEYTATTRRQRERERHRETGCFWGEHREPSTLRI